MNRTPRTLNRILLGLLGLVLAGIGGGLLWISLDPRAARSWQEFAPKALEDLQELGGQTQLSGQSWIWMLLALAMIVAIVLLILWAAAQGRGRTGTLVSEYDDDGGVPGRVAVSSATAEQALRSALQEDPNVASAAVSTYDVRGGSALRVRIQPRQGAAPQVIAADATALVEALDAALGQKTPVLISIDAGRKLRFSREDRVR